MAVTLSSYSQTITAQAYAGAFSELTDYGWSDWSEFEETNIVITIDPSNELVVINSQMEQVYQIIETYDLYTDEDGDEFMKFNCVDSEGIVCDVTLGKLISQGGTLQVYVDFADVRWVYNVSKL